jgi:hypothetical protein
MPDISDHIYHNMVVNNNDMELYDLANAKRTSPEMFQKYKNIIFGWCAALLRHKYQDMFSVDGNKINIAVSDRHKRFILAHTNEMLDVVYKRLSQEISTIVLQAMGAACFMISMKFFYGYDYMNDNGIANLLVESSDGGITKQQLLNMEIDILVKTEWKCCGLFDIYKYYADDDNDVFGIKKSDCKESKESTECK